VAVVSPASLAFALHVTIPITLGALRTKTEADFQLAHRVLLSCGTVSSPVPLELPLELLELIESLRSTLIYIVVAAGICSAASIVLAEMCSLLSDLRAVCVV
jgi:hypothetical protein